MADMADSLERMSSKQDFMKAAEAIQQRYHMKPDFDANASTLAQDDHPVIDDLAELIKGAYRDGAQQLKVLVDGHADTGQRPEPTPAPLRELCKARADAVKARLVSQGVPAGIIETKGSGATGINPNTLQEVAKNYNKRVYITCKAGLPSVTSPSPAQHSAKKPAQQCTVPAHMDLSSDLEDALKQSEELGRSVQRKEQERADAQAAAERADAERADAQAAAQTAAAVARQKQERLEEQLEAEVVAASTSKGGFATGGGIHTWVLFPVAGGPMSVVHVLMELFWLVAVLLYGETIYATLLTLAALDTTDECPDQEECGDTVSRLFICSVAQPILVVIGIIWLYSTHIDGQHLKLNPPHQHHSCISKGPERCYKAGCVLGIVVLGCQIYLLTPVDKPVLPYAADEHDTSGYATNATERRQLQFDSIGEYKD